MFKFFHALLLNSFTELLQECLEGLLPLSFPCGSAGIRMLHIPQPAAQHEVWFPCQYQVAPHPITTCPAADEHLFSLRLLEGPSSSLP